MPFKDSMANHVEVDINVLRKFALKLAGNEKKIRDIGVKKLRKWMTNRAGGDYGRKLEITRLIIMMIIINHDDG